MLTVINWDVSHSSDLVLVGKMGANLHSVTPWHYVIPPACKLTFAGSIPYIFIGFFWCVRPDYSNIDGFRFCRSIYPNSCILRSLTWWSDDLHLTCHFFKNFTWSENKRKWFSLSCAPNVLQLEALVFIKFAQL